MRKEAAVKLIAGAYCVIAAAYFAYSWYSYTGIYRAFVEWQIAQFGAYDLRISILVPLLVLLLPGAIAARVILGPRQARQVHAVAPKRGSSLRGLLIIAALALAIGGVALWLGYQKTNESVTFEALDLADHRVPQTTHVRVTAVALAPLTLRFTTESAGRTDTDNYVPLVPADWHKGDPLAYFMRTQIDAFQGPDGQ
jgi:hypothetical protein